MKKIKILVLIMLPLFYCAQSIAGTIRTLGDIGQIALPATGLVVAIAHKDTTGMVQLGLAYGATLATVYALKPLVNRDRPDGGSWSFPSGHTASAFAGAGFLQRRYGWNYGAPAYTAAWFVGLSRVYANRHWPTDVLAGAAIGIAANLIFTKPYHNVHIQTLAYKDGFGLELSFNK